MFGFFLFDHRYSELEVVFDIVVNIENCYTCACHWRHVRLVVWLLSVRNRYLRSERRRLVSVRGHVHSYVRSAVGVNGLGRWAVEERRGLDHLRRVRYSSSSNNMLLGWAAAWMWSCWIVCRLRMMSLSRVLVGRLVLRSMMMRSCSCLLLLNVLLLRMSSLPSLSMVLVAACLRVA